MCKYTTVRQPYSRPRHNMTHRRHNQTMCKKRTKRRQNFLDRAFTRDNGTWSNMYLHPQSFIRVTRNSKMFSDRDRRMMAALLKIYGARTFTDGLVHYDHALGEEAYVYASLMQWIFQDSEDIELIRELITGEFAISPNRRCMLDRCNLNFFAVRVNSIRTDKPKKTDLAIIELMLKYGGVNLNATVQMPYVNDSQLTCKVSDIPHAPAYTELIHAYQLRTITKCATKCAA